MGVIASDMKVALCAALMWRAVRGNKVGERLLLAHTFNCTLSAPSQGSPAGALLAVFARHMTGGSSAVYVWIRR